MGWRVGATWALIGLAARCFSAVAAGMNLADGLWSALGHYVAWGVAGALVGSVTESVLTEAFEAKTRKERTAAPPAESPTPTGRQN